MQMKLISDLPAEKNRKDTGFFSASKFFIMTQPQQDDGTICLYLFTHYNLLLCSEIQD